MDQLGKVANLARGQLNRENNIPLSPCGPGNLVSRDGFSRPVPRQPAPFHTQAVYSVESKTAVYSVGSQDYSILDRVQDYSILGRVQDYSILGRVQDYSILGRVQDYSVTR